MEELEETVKRETIVSRVKSYAVLLLLLVIAAGCFVATRQLPYPIVDQLLKQDLQQESKLWRKRVVDQLSHAPSTFAEKNLTPSDISLLSTITHNSDIYRFKLFDRTGLVLWSSRESDIGTVQSDPFFSELVLNGEIVYKHEPKHASEIDEFELHAVAVDGEMNREVAEIYTPILDNGRVLGAIEFYIDITNRRDIFANRVQLLLAATSAMGLGLMLVVVLVVFRSGRRQLQLLEKRSTAERDGLKSQMRLAREVRLLGELNEWLQSSRSLDELFDMVARFMTHMLPDCSGSVYVYSNSRDVLDGAVSWNGGSHKDHIHPEECWGLRRGRTYTYGNSEVDFACEHTDPDDKRPYFCFPILAHGETVGLMHLRAKEMVPIEGFKPNQRLAQMCAEQISLAIANVQMRDQLHERSVRDPLTGLFNRRHMTDHMRKLVNRIRTHETTFSLVYLDVDHFKKFNDNHGHDAGDLVLRAVGDLLQRSCQDGDEIACRMGGEEFMLILPEVQQADVLKRTEKLRRDVENITVRYGEKNLPRITISAGIAHAPEHGTDTQELLRVADAALYDAKARGRNQVVVADLSALDTDPEADEARADALFLEHQDVNKLSAAE
ncbi:diguanylate cyclase [Actibacterium mucosum KCTC 23349]|uniref:diguanylate cyclase n=1 Tax=Actibacterium mucosum KCTC 23349 TaxID=1454373 RepID=A0A037ZCU5_9RHOB|nr:diguanylate cyclase [Actibacterium mucosum]KAJ54319.1 diguanylate cyclase [Actibacterium mucosum KCTC 23349]